MITNAIIGNKIVQIEFDSIEIIDNKTTIKCNKVNAIIIAKLAIAHCRNFIIFSESIIINGDILNGFFTYNGIMCKSLLSSIGIENTFKKTISSLKTLKQSTDFEREKLQGVNEYVDGLFKDISNTFTNAIINFSNLNKSFESTTNDIFEFASYKYSKQNAAYKNVNYDSDFYKYVEDLKEYVKNYKEE